MKWNDLPRRVRNLSALALAVTAIGWSPGVAGSPAAAQGAIPNGFWVRTDPDATYESFLRVTGNKGFKCVLDEKSSYAFTLAGDSMTSPMNGKLGIRWFPGSGDLQITGMEKGEIFVERFGPLDSAAYWSKCADEDPSFVPVAVKPRPQPDARALEGKAGRDALGRMPRNPRIAAHGRLPGARR